MEWDRRSILLEVAIRWHLFCQHATNPPSIKKLYKTSCRRPCIALHASCDRASRVVKAVSVQCAPFTIRWM
eukprot:278335-Chlamydomonas_euryale.AAC.14